MKQRVNYKFLAELTQKHKPAYLRLLFWRKGWKIKNIDDVRKYLKKHLNNCDD